MDGFHLKRTLEYKAILRKKNIIDAIISKLNYFDKPYTEVIFDILKETSGEPFIKSYYGAEYKTEEKIINRRLSILWTLTRSGLFKNMAAEINAKIEKDFDYFTAISAYSFVEYLFRHHLALEDASGRPPGESFQQISASAMKKKAEEIYKKGYYDQAAAMFYEALELTPGDHIILFRLGIYNFFEKADHLNSFAYFEKSAAAADGDGWIKSAALCFCALIARLEALHNHNPDLARKALSLSDKALKYSPDSIMARYCGIQNTAALYFLEKRGAEFADNAADFFSQDYNFLLQAVMDNAFDANFDIIADLSGNRYDDALNRCTAIIEEVNQKITQIPARLENSADTARKFHIQKEFKSAQEYFKKNKTCADLEEIIKRLENIIKSIDLVLNSDKAQILYIKLKKYCDEILPEYYKDSGGRLKPYKEALKRREKLNEHIKSLINKYFDTAYGEEIASFDGSDVKYRDLKINMNKFELISSKCCLYGFFSFESVLLLLWPIAGILNFLYFIMLTAVNLFLIPLYRTAGAGAVYFTVRLRLDELKREFSKLELKLKLSDNLPGEAEAKARDRYSKQIAAEFKISQIDAKNVLEAAIAGEHKKIKNIARMISKSI